jgi:UDP-N-acetylmuramate--alanine ligase
MRIGIFFGGTSREREISFAGGRTVYDNLDKAIFEPVPIFLDSLGRFILLDWAYIYKGTIRDFYPPVQFLPESPHNFQVYIESLAGADSQTLEAIANSVGRRITIEELPGLIDFAFLCLHGTFGEDGALQGLLEILQIPYSGSGILPCAIGIDKSIQKKLFAESNFESKPYVVIYRDHWLGSKGVKEDFDRMKAVTSLPMVIRPANQGSSIGVSIVFDNDPIAFEQAVDAAFFTRHITRQEWQSLDEDKKVPYVQSMADIKEGIGLPARCTEKLVNTPDELLALLETSFAAGTDTLFFESLDEEPRVIIEGFIRGKEFSCVVVEDEDGRAIALPPTEIVKNDEVFDYRSKYLAGLSSKVTPIRLPETQINAIRRECERLYHYLEFDVYARIDGFITEDGTIFLNDPNTTSGMLPSSFFFHQAAEIGLNPSQFITYIIRASLLKRIARGGRNDRYKAALAAFDAAEVAARQAIKEKTTVGVILGGYSSERHISVESGRNIFEKLASSGKYNPIPLFLSGHGDDMQLHVLPINLLLKDNADDIHYKIEHYSAHPVIEQVRQEAHHITDRFATAGYKFAPETISFAELAEKADAVFIALHGRPGEDGTLQAVLEQYGIPYNGSLPSSAQLTIDKYATKAVLRQNGMLVAQDQLVWKQDWLADPKAILDSLETAFGYPFIAKPVDDGCSSAVKKIDNRTEMEAFATAMFRDSHWVSEKEANVLHLKPKEEFPAKEVILIEELISRKDARHFLEVTGGMLTTYDSEDNLVFEVFEPSEALATDAILSLEEKFLAGQGQNLTPARFGKTQEDYTAISHQVKRDLMKAAQLSHIQGYCRIDAFVRVFDNNRVETIVIEINSLPGMTPATVIFHQAAINQYKPFDLIDKIIQFGIQRKNKQLSHSTK